jgi:predicted naringenin-chalcone synthase
MSRTWSCTGESLFVIDATLVVQVVLPFLFPLYCDLPCSCTGFSAPGIDFHLIGGLGLSSSTRKIGCNFMGCFGAFTALYTAKQIVEADTTGKAVVLVACVELCTLHMEGVDQRLELIVGNAIFADGAAAAIVTHAGKSGVQKGDSEWALGGFASEIIPETGGAMTWKQGGICRGGAPYRMWLDRQIPKALGGFFGSPTAIRLAANIGILNIWKSGLAWCIHPGGKSIITGIEKEFATLKIQTRGLEVSKEVLRSYGNMSSPTVLFCLQRILWPGTKDADEPSSSPSSSLPSDVFMIGFGPGLTVEAARCFRLTVK